MPIQFACPGCGQPIEVDDEHAGRSAACPYCQRVVTVPNESTYLRDQVPAARPSLDRPPMPPTGGFAPPSPTDDLGKARARVTGNWALVCAALVVVSIVAASIQLAQAAAPRWNAIAATQPANSPEVQEQMAAEMQKVMLEQATKPTFLALMAASMLFALIGLALAIVSLVQSRGFNWRAGVALVLCGAPTLCTCAGMLSNLAR